MFATEFTEQKDTGCFHSYHAKQRQWEPISASIRHSCSGARCRHPEVKACVISILCFLSSGDKKGSSTRLSGQFPFTHAHSTAHHSLHSFPKYNFLWSKWQALPQGGEWCQSWITGLRFLPAHMLWPYLYLIGNHSTHQKRIKQTRK